MSYKQKYIYFTTLKILFWKAILVELWGNHFSHFQRLLKIEILRFLGYFFIIFCSGFVFSSINNHIYPHVFPPHSVKVFWYNLFHPLLFRGINKNWDSRKILCLQKVGGGGDFLGVKELLSRLLSKHFCLQSFLPKIKFLYCLFS